MATMLEDLAFVVFKMAFIFMGVFTALAGYMLYRLFKLNREP